MLRYGKMHEHSSLVSTRLQGTNFLKAGSLQFWMLPFQESRAHRPVYPHLIYLQLMGASS